VDAAGLGCVDEQLDSFVGEVFSSLARKDRRATAGLYVRGLMLDGRRKSMQPMAQRLRGGSPAVAAVRDQFAVGRGAGQ